MLARVIFALVALVGVADAFVAPGAFVVRSKVAAVDGPVMVSSTQNTVPHTRKRHSRAESSM